MIRIDLYVDGSYIEGEKEVNGAVIALANGELCSAIRLHTEDVSVLSHRQISGEVFSALYGLQCLCDSKSSAKDLIDEIVVHYDYTGIENWVTGVWKKTNNVVSSQYKERMLSLISSFSIKGIKVRFEKIKAHSGNRYNEMADKLASTGTMPKEAEEVYDGTVLYSIVDGQVVFT